MAATIKTATLMDELLDLPRLPMGRSLELEGTPTDLVALVGRVVAEHHQATDRHRIEVASDAPTLVGEWDAGRLKRVVGNLVSNAIKSSPGGGPITLRIGREAAAWRANRDWAGLSVRDQGIGGIGIPPAGLPFIFGRFQRAGNVAGHIAGTGIGLASVRQIVEQRGATVTVESRAGTGATFTVRLSMVPGQVNGS